MATTRQLFTRPLKAVAAGAAALAIALTSLVATAPSAAGYGEGHCVVSKTVVRRGGTDAALCRHFARFHWGAAYVTRHHRPHRLVLKRFRTGHRGNTLFGFRIKPRVPLGRVRVSVRVGHRRTSFFILVRRHRRPKRSAR